MLVDALVDQMLVTGFVQTAEVDLLHIHTRIEHCVGQVRAGPFDDIQGKGEVLILDRIDHTIDGLPILGMVGCGSIHIQHGFII